MIAKTRPKKSEPRKPAKKSRTDWRETLRRRLAKVPEIDGIFVARLGGVVHVFTVIAEHQSEIYDLLMKQESLVEKDHPRTSFDFHTREHQGRPPHRAVPHDAELVYLKK